MSQLGLFLILDVLTSSFLKNLPLSLWWHKRPKLRSQADLCSIQMWDLAEINSMVGNVQTSSSPCQRLFTYILEWKFNLTLDSTPCPTPTLSFSLEFRVDALWTALLSGCSATIYPLHVLEPSSPHWIWGLGTGNWYNIFLWQLLLLWVIICLYLWLGGLMLAGK